ncbi:signal peptide peptidase SppA [Candidatus Woesearchaeota archaeon]|nr:signal peptide peptidase SppA [Candidatus Woesearchaeota archaeon]
MKKTETPQINVRGRWAVVIIVLLFLALTSFITALIVGIFVSTSVDESGNVAHIKITGPIVADADSGLFSGGAADSTEITRLIEKADGNPGVKAILFEINSPGGTAVASYEIAAAIKKTNKTTAAWMREAGASGAYWAATATDHIVANPMTITGSIGVIASYIEWGGTLERYNASYRRLVSGEYKDLGSPFKPMTPGEEEMMQKNLDIIRQVFVDDVAKNRKLPQETVDEVADGRFYLGVQAKELGLVDELGGKDEAVAWIEKKEGIEAELAEYRKPKTLAEVLTGVFAGNSFELGRGIGKTFLDAKVVKGAEIST